jgi:DHA3 family macrolide efflux protein-like MFS transporter
MVAFTTVWLGQAISLLGTSMSGFGLTIWAYEVTGQATALALVGFFFIAPMVAFSPIAGAIVDRSNRKLMMMISDLAAGVTTIAVLALYATGQLQIWHLYITSFITGTFQTFQWPAYSAAITLMLPKEQYGRANGMIELAGASSNIFAPLLAGALLGVIGISGLLIIDIVTFVVAVGALLLVHVPQPARTEVGKQAQGSIWKESAYGFRHIFARPSLLGLQIVFMLGNFFSTLGYTVMAPMILARTGNDAMVFGATQTAGAIGGVVGGLAMSAWGGTKRRVHGVLSGWGLSSLLGQTLMGLARALPGWATANFIAGFFVPIVNGSNQAIWMAKVEPDVQGRVFATRRLIAWLVSPIATLIAGPLADYVFEPAMQEGGRLADRFGWLVGTGPGAGMSLMMVLTGLAAALVGFGAYGVRVVRDAEEILPDHDAAVAADA